MKIVGDSWIEDFNNLISKEKELQKLVKKHSKKTIYNPDHNDNIFTTQLENDEKHDTLLDICISAFTPGSYCCDVLNYCFITSEPLIELGVKNFDALIINQSKRHGIFIECKSSISKGVVKEGYDQIDEVKNNKSHLEKKIGNKLDLTEFVFCTPATKVQQLATQIENVENNLNINSNKDPVFLIWQVDFFYKQILQIVTKISIKTRKNNYSFQHNNLELTKKLSNGIEISESEYVPKMYPSSNPFTQGKHLISRLYTDNEISINLRKKNIDPEEKERVRKTILEKDIYDFFQKRGNLTHYDSDIIGKKLADHFIGESINLGILKKITPESYCLELEGKQLKTVLNNYEKVYKSSFLTHQVNKKAYKEYRERHPSIQDFF